MYYDWMQMGNWVDEYLGLKMGQVDQIFVVRKIVFDVWIVSSFVKMVDVDVKVRFIFVVFGKDVVDFIIVWIIVVVNSIIEVFIVREVFLVVFYVDDYFVLFDIFKYDLYVIYIIIEVDGQVIVKDLVWFDFVKYFDMFDCNVKFEFVWIEGIGVYVMVDKFVMGFVFEEVESMGISDNGFDLMFGEKQFVKVF